MVDSGMRTLIAVLVVAVGGLGMQEAMAKGARVKSSSRPTTNASKPAKPADKDPDSSGGVNIRIRSQGSSGSSSAPVSAAAPAQTASYATPAAAAAAAQPKESAEEVRERIARRNAELLAENERRERRRAEDERLIAKVQKDRELEAAAAKQRDEERKRAVMARFSQSSCVFKPVMTDAEMAACRGR